MAALELLNNADTGSYESEIVPNVNKHTSYVIMYPLHDLSSLDCDYVTLRVQIDVSTTS